MAQPSDQVTFQEEKTRKLMFQMGMALLEQHREPQLRPNIGPELERLGKQWNEVVRAGTALEVLDHQDVRSAGPTDPVPLQAARARADRSTTTALNEEAGH